MHTRQSLPSPGLFLLQATNVAVAGNRFHTFSCRRCQSLQFVTTNPCAPGSGPPRIFKSIQIKKYKKYKYTNDRIYKKTNRQIYKVQFYTSIRASEVLCDHLLRANTLLNSDKYIFAIWSNAFGHSDTTACHVITCRGRHHLWEIPKGHSAYNRIPSLLD